MRNKGKLNTWYAMFFDSKSLITTKRGITAGQRQRLNPEQKIGGKHQRKKTSVTGWVSWVPWFPEADIQYKSEGKTIGKDMPRCCHTPWIKLSQKSIWEWHEKYIEILWNTVLLRILHPSIPSQFAGKSVNALRLSCRSLTCNLRVDGTSCRMQATRGVTWII